MIGLFSSYSVHFMGTLALSVLFFFGLPILLFPLRWARMLGWEIPASTPLAVYFGRCLGALICVMAVFGARAAFDPVVRPFMFQMVGLTVTSMVFIHVYGAIKRVQPPAETAEIGLWVSLLVLDLLFYPAMPGLS